MMHWTSSDQKIPEGKLTSASSFEICCPSREVAQTCQGGYPNPAIEGELAVQNVCGAVYGWWERVPSTRSPCQQHASVRMSRNTAHVACGACGGRAGKWVSGEVAVHLGPPVLDKVERSWSCWRHPNASGVGVNVACAMGNTRFSQAQGDFLEGGCGVHLDLDLGRVS